MSYRGLREAAKFCAGIVTADLLTVLWMWSNNLFPFQIWGVTWTSSVVLPGVIFDLAVIIFLVHYGWHLGKIPRPRERTYLLVAGVIFTIIALAHLTRIFTQGSLVIFNWSVPLWLSWIGTIVTAYLAYASFHFATTRSRR
ncbi:MAG: hypothetical protein KGJ34_00390 [Patescibacteria group bacterium]|nr:hypothetical protein [Patescibacteria group bacterium]